MILVLDIGNSRLKWGAWSDRRWHGQGVLALTEVSKVAALANSYAPEWLGVCCVADENVRRQVEGALKGIPCVWLRSVATGHGVINRYTRPEKLGADRFANLVACQRKGLSPCVVVSAGTALTVDALTGQGEFVGGMILPGAAMMRNGLANGTAGVSATQGSWQAFPRLTEDAVETGIWTALSGAVEAMRSRLVNHLGLTVQIVLTGGDGDRLASHLPGMVRVEQNLVLEGVLWMARDLNIPGV